MKEAYLSMALALPVKKYQNIKAWIACWLAWIACVLPKRNQNKIVGLGIGKYNHASLPFAKVEQYRNIKAYKKTRWYSIDTVSYMY